MTRKHDEAEVKYDHIKNDDLYGSAIPVVAAVPSGPPPKNPIPPGHSRYYCEKCTAVRKITDKKRFYFVVYSLFLSSKSNFLFYVIPLHCSSMIFLAI